MTRKGKIARLPVETRNLLNHRIEDGEQGVKLVDWLNGLPVVQKVLASEFDGRPISEQNFSEWKQGGYEDWLKHQEAKTWVREIAERAAELKIEAGESSIADWIAAPLAVVLGRTLEQLAAKAESDPESRKALMAIAREIIQVRRGDHAEKRTRIEDERWKTQQAQTADEKRKAEERAARWAAHVANGFADLREQAQLLADGPIAPELRAVSQAISKMPLTNGSVTTATQTADQTKSR